ncbi:hypothetical protein Pla111_24120 [Botrimarina hoheduenensis]|uniref:Uncharacterized protein n=1 Tax=Botrimarina hoheduenensis TaxID=2528000 RepID=A0A5C5W0G4_9BACT|nr:hypothetical protein Pla111_24120 [Botrimarina hoheduenensis]
MPNHDDERALWDVIRRNPRLDNLITYYLRCDAGRELLTAIEESEQED